MSNEHNKAHAVPQGEPVAWYEYDETRDCWFLAYTRNPRVITRPLVFGDVLPAPAAPSQPGTLTDEEIDKAILEPLNALLDHIYEHTNLSEGILPLARKIANAIIAALREKQAKATP